MAEEWLGPDEGFDAVLKYVVWISSGQNLLGVGVVFQDTAGVPWVLTVAHIFNGATSALSVEFVDDPSRTTLPVDIAACRKDEDFCFLKFIGTMQRPGATMTTDAADFRRGVRYVAVGMGISVQPRALTYLSGHTCSDVLTGHRVGLGGGANFGDSGAPVFSLDNLKLIGIVMSGEENQESKAGLWTRTMPWAWMKPCLYICEASKKPATQNDFKMIRGQVWYTGLSLEHGTLKNADAPNAPRERKLKSKVSRLCKRSALRSELAKWPWHYKESDRWLAKWPWDSKESDSWLQSKEELEDIRRERCSKPVLHARGGRQPA